MPCFFSEHVLKGEFAEFWIPLPTHLGCYWNNITFFTRGKDHLLYQENSENIKDTFPASHHRVILPDERLRMNPSNQPLSFPTSTDPEALPRRDTRVLSVHSPATKDLLSGLCAAGFIFEISLQTTLDDISCACLDMKFSEGKKRLHTRLLRYSQKAFTWKPLLPGLDWNKHWS